MIRIEDGYVSFEGYRTYYRIANPEGKKIPLLLLHGGPGSTHNSFEVLDELALLDDRPVISYDQIGCGFSSLQGSHPGLYNKDFWIRELINLRLKLNLHQVHLLGHSWGGMLEILYLTERKPFGVVSATLSSTLSSASLWKAETHRLLKYLSAEDQKAVEMAEETGDYQTLEFQLASRHYAERYVSGPVTEETPDCVKRSRLRGEESYLVAWGTSEFTPTGNLAGYEVTDHLKDISCPVLLLSGTDDESTPYQNKVMYEALKGEKKWVLLPGARHATYVEKTEDYIREVMAFLNHCEEN